MNWNTSLVDTWEKPFQSIFQTAWAIRLIEGFRMMPEILYERLVILQALDYYLGLVSIEEMAREMGKS